MSAKGSSSLGTLLFSIPLAAIPLMAIFGIPQFAPLVASPERGDGYDRSLDERLPEDRSPLRRSADVLRSRGLETSFGRDDMRDDQERRSNLDRSHAGGYGEPPDRLGEPPASWSGDPQDRASRSQQSDDDAPPFYSDERQPIRTLDALTEQRLSRDTPADRTDATGLSWQSAAQQFEDLGITSYHLEPGSDIGSFLFVCSFCPQASSNVTMRFEAESTEPLEAVGDVLSQIDHWQQQQGSIGYQR